jgi:hypothetical protein
MLIAYLMTQSCGFNMSEELVGPGVNSSPELPLFIMAKFKKLFPHIQIPEVSDGLVDFTHTGYRFSEEALKLIDPKAVRIHDQEIEAEKVLLTAQLAAKQLVTSAAAAAVVVENAAKDLETHLLMDAAHGAANKLLSFASTAKNNLNEQKIAIRLAEQRETQILLDKVDTAAEKLLVVANAGQQDANIILQMAPKEANKLLDLTETKNNLGNQKVEVIVE